ncbi:Beta carbonic anhydrase 5, chloroplastic [Linum perenne]
MAILSSPSSLSNNPSSSLIPSSSSAPSTPSFARPQSISSSELANFRSLTASKSMSACKLKVLSNPTGLTKERENDDAATVSAENLFDDMKSRFLSFKKNKYLENKEHYERLAESQAPKFLVIACGDSRVCPSNILGFQPGEAFVVRNVANLVPPFESGPSETKAALEFAVNTLKVQNILVVGHSRCGGIRALMSMHDDVETSSFIGGWVSVGMNARTRTKAVASNLSFDNQCTHCEKESVNCTLSNLLTYPWIEEKVRSEELSIHGGYYDFVNCTFEKWTLDYQQDGAVSVKDRSRWS